MCSPSTKPPIKTLIFLPLDFLLFIVQFSSSYRYWHANFGILQLQFNFPLSYHYWFNFFLPTIMTNRFWIIVLAEFNFGCRIQFWISLITIRVFPSYSFQQINLGLRLQYLVCVKLFLQDSILDISNYCLISPFRKLQ